MREHIFSLPFCNTMSEYEVKNRYIPFLHKYKKYIYDIYFTCIIPPFEDDGMGTSKESEDAHKETVRVFKLMMDIQKKTGIRVSATFNNIKVDPTAENLEIFVRNLRALYARGLRSMTIPHYHWMACGILQKEFPDMHIKNTILRKVSRPQEYADSVEAGFDLVNIDRYNLRDRDNLIRLKKAYDRYKVPMSILVNEGCRGNCPAMDEHFMLNCSSDDLGNYFSQALASVTCTKWKALNPAYRLQTALMPPLREDFEEILEYVQVLKLHGRSVLSVLYSSMEIIRRWADKSEYVLPGMQKQIEMYNYDEKKLKQWRVFVKNCKFECWDCHMCQDLHSSAKIQALSFEEVM